MDAWQVIGSRAQSMDDVMIVLSMLLVQAISRASDPQLAVEPLLQQVNQFVRDTLEENLGDKPRAH